MSSQWLRRTEAVSNGFEFGHAAIGQRTGPDRVIAQISLSARTFVSGMSIL